MNFTSHRRLPAVFVPMLLAVLAALLITACGLPPIFSYQGRLLDGTGSPVADGDYEARFVLYRVAAGGTGVYTETKTIAVEDGLFNSEVGMDSMPTELFQNPLWMEVTIEGETLTPRQPLRGAPYAFSLASGAVIAGTETITRSLPLYSNERTGATVLAFNTGEGHGLVGATSSNWLPSGIFNLQRAGGVTGVAQNRGYGGYFKSENATGLYAEGITGGTAGVFVGNIAVTGNCNGCALAYTARNDGSTAIAAGDLVAASGVEIDPALGTPILLVRRATSADEAIVGVSGGGVNRTVDGVIASGKAADAGGYLSVVVQGLAQVHVGGGSSVAIGNSLTASVEGAVLSTDAVGSVARAMSAPDANGMVWAMIDGQ